MSVVTINPRIWLAQYHLSADHSEVEVSKGHEAQDATVFTNTAKQMRGTIPFVEATGKGYVDFSSLGVHDALKTNLNVADVPLTISMEGVAEQKKVQMFLASILQYSTPGVVGTLLPFNWSAKGRGTPSVDGLIFGDGEKAATSNGASNQLGLLAAGERMFAVQHVLSVSGTSPTLDTIIQSDNGSVMASPSTRITFAQKAAVGSEWKELDGAVATDTWWRAKWTIGGSSTPTFDVLIAVGKVAIP